MQLLKNEEIPEDKWYAFISDNPFNSPFQTPSFYYFFNSIPGQSAEVYAVEDILGIKVLCVITIQKEQGVKGFFSKRAIIYGGPVIEKHDKKSFDFLLVSIDRVLKKRAIYIEIRNLNDYNYFRKNFEKNNWDYISYCNYQVDCQDIDKLNQELGNNRKRQIKKAINSGAKIKEAEDLNEIDDFYLILKNIYRQKIKKPLPPKQFFEEFFNKDLGKFLLVTYRSRIIGGIMCPILKGKKIYELYVCGLDEDFKGQYPSVLATWAAIEYANKNNIQIFDFMGAGKPDEQYGVRDFKARFGGELVEYGRYLKINNHFLYKIGIFALYLKKKLNK